MIPQRIGGELRAPGGQGPVFRSEEETGEMGQPSDAGSGYEPGPGFIPRADVRVGGREEQAPIEPREGTEECRPGPALDPGSATGGTDSLPRSGPMIVEPDPCIDSAGSVEEWETAAEALSVPSWGEEPAGC